MFMYNLCFLIAHLNFWLTLPHVRHSLEPGPRCLPQKRNKVLLRLVIRQNTGQTHLPKRVRIGAHLHLPPNRSGETDTLFHRNNPLPVARDT